jgi:HK97 family phage prohead protease/HK97 family phage major capsid protein
MDKILHVASMFKSQENDDGSVMIRGMASTNHSDRAGDVISKEAWEKGGLENFKNNPVILFNHDYDKPIGRATGVKVTENGLELEAKISKSAPAHVCELVKDGVLGAFSVGFKVKDADYIKETDGLMIKDAELFEVSVVSVPCNQAATFSLAKSFDSEEEYNEFKKTFTNRVDLTGQSLTKEDEISSNLVSDAPTSSEKSEKQEIKMDTNESGFDLEAFAKKVAEETAAKIAMKQAEQKAAADADAKIAADAAAEKAAQDEQVKSTIRTGIETGTERLLADVEAKMSEKDASLQEVMETFKKELTEKQEEIEALNASKKSFQDRGRSADLTSFGQEFLQAKLLGAISRKGMDTSYAQGIMEKAGVDAVAQGNLDTIISNQFIDQVMYNQQLGGLFEELAVTSGKTTLPITKVPKGAVFSTGGFTDATSLNDDGTPANGYSVDDVTVSAYRLVAGTFVSNDIDEQLVVSLLPQISNQLAKAHAVAIDAAIVGGHGGGAIKGLIATGGTLDVASLADGFATGDTTTGTVNADITTRYPTPELLAGLRSGMGAYGQNTGDLAIIVNPDAYYSMIHTTGFTDISEVGNDLATKITGEVGSIFGIKVIVSDAMPVAAHTNAAGILINTTNFVRPRLGGVNFETEYSVVNQRTNLVASQSVGFDRLVADAASAKLIRYPAAS